MTNNNYKDDIFSDELVELDKDAFNFENEAEQLAKKLKRGKAPFVAAICGEWGSGKSSFLRFLHKKLKDKNSIIIYFNAWRGSIHQSPEIAFIYELRKQLKKSSIFDRKTKEFTRIFKSLISSSLDVFSEKQNILGYLLKTYKKTKEKLKDEIEETIKSEGKLLTSFEKLCALIPEGMNIYVFIDELDRCSPETAVKIIESLKKFFYGKDILYEDILGRQEEKRNNTFMIVFKHIIKNVLFEIITPLFFTTDKRLRKKKRIDIPSIPFKYIIAIDEGYVVKAFASHYKLSKSEAMNYLSKFIQYRYYIKDYDWSKYIKNIISNLKVDSDFWTDQHILDINHILINAFRVYNPRTVKKIVKRIIIHQSNSNKSYQEQRNILTKNFKIEEIETSTSGGFVYKERILRSVNIHWAIDSCIHELFQSEIEWYLKYSVFGKFPQTSKDIKKAQEQAQGLKYNWAIIYFNHNYEVPESELKKDNGQVRKNVELMAFAIDQSIGHIREMLNNLQINNSKYDANAPHEYFIRIFKHLIKNEWEKINSSLFKRS